MAHHPRPSPSGPFSKPALLAFSSMIAFVAGVSVYPRVTLTRTADAWTLHYHRRTLTQSARPPADPGLLLSSGTRDETAASSSRAAGRRIWSDNDWILDTGATTHVCTDAKRMHNYTSFENSALMRSVGHFGPNPVRIKGMGECTLDLPGVVAPIEGRGLERGRLTISNVSHMPEAGINIVSWSQLRRARGLRLRLRDNEDGSLGVVKVEGEKSREIMRFRLRDGLYFLEQEKE